MPIGGSFEAREAHVADIILRTHEFILPLRNGLIPSKPPLFHWLVALISAPFGAVFEYSVRIPSVISAAVLVYITGRFADSTINKEAVPAKRHELIGITASGILSLTYGFQILAMNAMVDMLLGCLVVSAAFLYLQAAFRARSLTTFQVEAPSGLSSRDYLYFWLLCALAVLAKGPLGLIVPGIICFTALLPALGVRGAAALLLKPHYGWLLGALIAASWYALAALRGGYDFILRQLFFENIARFSGGELVNQEAWWFYFPSFLRTAAPWSIFLLALILWHLIKALRKKEAPAWTRDKTLRGLMLASAALFVFFSLASGKRHSYLLPIYPLISIILAPSAVAFWDSAPIRFRKRCIWSLLALGGITSTFFALLALNILWWRSHLPDLVNETMQDWLSKQLVSPAIIFLLILLSFSLSAWTMIKRAAVPAWRLWLSPLLLMLAVMAYGTGIKNGLKRFEGAARSITARVAPAESLAVVRSTHDELFDVVLFYLRRDVSIISPQDISAVCDGRTQFVLMREALVLGSPALSSKVIEVFSQAGDALKERRDRNIALLRCN